MTALLLALAGLVAEIAAWQQQLNRTHQAAAARDTARELPELARAAAGPLQRGRLPRAASDPAATPAPPTQVEPDWARPARLGLPISDLLSRGQRR